MRKTIIAAVARNGIIGCSNRGLPWHVPEDFRHFKQTTMRHPIIMGRTTWLEFKKPLPGRLNIVLSFNDEEPCEGFVFCKTMEEALSFAESSGAEKCFIIGGKMVFAEAIKFVDEMILSHLNFESDGDIPFPDIEPALWDVEKETGFEQFTVRYYKRREQVN